MKTYNENGYNLEFPDEWTLELDEDGPGNSLTLNAPSGDFWSLTRYPAYIDPDALLTEGVEALTAEYKDAEVSTASETYSHRKLEGFDIDFFYLDLPCIAMVRTLRFGLYTYILIVQTMDQSASTIAEIKAINAFWTEHLKLVEF